MSRWLRASYDGFAVSPRKQLFVCRPSGTGGDLIAMTMHCLGTDFKGAVEYITGGPRPGSRAVGRR